VYTIEGFEEGWENSILFNEISLNNEKLLKTPSLVPIKSRNVSTKHIFSGPFQTKGVAKLR